MWVIVQPLSQIGNNTCPVLIMMLYVRDIYIHYVVT